MNRQVFNLSNAKCAGCVSKIQTKLNSMDGISDAKVNLLEKTLTVVFKDKALNEEVISAVEALGFGASVESIKERSQNLGVDIILPIILSIIMMVVTMSSWFHSFIQSQTNLLFSGTIFALISFVLILISGLNIIKSGCIGFKTLNPNMHSLILLGISSAWVYSVITLAFIIDSNSTNWHSYFDSSLMILGFVNLGAYIEDRAKKSTLKSVSALASLIPETVTILRDGKEEIVVSNLLRIDDLVLVRPGDKVAADGVIVSGSAYVNESMLTGESLPITKCINAEVIGGSINIAGSFVFKIIKTGTNTLLANIIDLIRDAQLKKPKLAKLADNIARVFVPAIIVVALVMGIIWYFSFSNGNTYLALNIFMSILLVACPCSIGLAIPVSLMVGVGRAANFGIMIRDPSCLSSIDKVDTVVFDKTGTLTNGKPKVIAYKYSDIVNNEIIGEIMAVINHSSHPLSVAIVEQFMNDDNKNIVYDFVSKDGYGVSGVVNSHDYQIGSLEYILQSANGEGIIVEDSIESKVYVARDGVCIASYSLKDTVKIGARELISHFKKNKFNIVMLTGDNNGVAKTIANELGINHFVANCKPEEKLNYIKALQESGSYVVFVGDGINDAPSLVASDVGIAIGSGSTIAKESAPISLLSEDISLVLRAINISRAINKNMRQNLYGSFIYNLFAIAIAAGILYPINGMLLNPMLASIIMSCSSILVIVNALRLRYT
ncbi:MAG: heavy metal translocating P-type ATPase [Burkholderiales bacterium]|nr:heavy metal translocating P-type ATPase [Burkholderiales bacterium]